MTFSKVRAVEGIRAGLWESAVLFTQHMFKKIHEVNAPKNIVDATSLGSPVRDGQSDYIEISINLETAPAARAFEYGSGIHGQSKKEYPITSKSGGALAIPRERWPKYQPPPDSDPVILRKVMHPGVVARPYIIPTIQETKEEITKILGREFVASIRSTRPVEIIE